MSELCRVYWYPLYAYARRAGRSPEDAEDLTQGFLLALLRRNSLAGTSREKGKLRSFLLASLKNFMRDEWRKANQEKRGGRQTIVSIDLQSSEDRYARMLVDKMTPEKAYDRLWVFALLDEVMKQFSDECEEKGKLPLLLKAAPYLNMDVDDRCPYAEFAAEFGLTESGIRVAVHRLRARYRELLRERIADTLASEDGLDEELSYLMSLFERG
ncbi:MAG: sigma-70 family RNA polymerase sigma factor [Verrucomicrobiota bacterium]